MKAVEFNTDRSTASLLAYMDLNPADMNEMRTQGVNSSLSVHNLRVITQYCIFDMIAYKFLLGS